MLKFFLLAIFVSYSYTACVDKVDNVLSATDCATSTAWGHLSNVKIMTYDSKGNPVCKMNQGQSKLEGDIQFPGQIKVGSGTVKVNGAHTMTGSTLGLTFEKLHSVLIGKLCVDGHSKNIIFPDKYCHFDFCTLIGSQFCDMLAKGGTFNIEDFPQLAKPIDIPALTGDLAFLAGIIKGEWNAGGDIMMGTNQVACALVSDIDIE